MDGRDLERVDAVHPLEGLPVADDLACRVADDADDDRHAAAGLLDRDLGAADGLFERQGVALAGAAAQGHAVDPGREQVAQLGAQRLLIQVLGAGRKRRDEGRNDASQ